ncbi:MAG: hypothetical protein KJP00_09865 [Bacteroidia bacterium]|nr:hypothetical protein [Bacteroidia bacterium]
MKSSSPFKYQNAILLTLAFISGIFLSPKWTIAIAAWIYFTVLLRFFRDTSWKGYLISIPVLTISTYIAQVDVLPLDPVTMLIFLVVVTTFGILPFLIDRLIYRIIPGWFSTLIFPTFFTLFNYIIDMGPQGTWGNVAYSQYEFLSLMQISSITGIYGINFLIYWFASSANYFYERRSTAERTHFAIWAMPVVLLLSVGYGMTKLMDNQIEENVVTMSTITMDNLSISKSMYKCAFDEDIEIPKYVSQSDPVVLELQKGMIAFMGDHENSKYDDVYTQMDKHFLNYIRATEEVAKQGAKIVTWSEGAIVNVKSRDKEFESLASELADKLDIYLFYPTAVFHPEKVGAEDRFIENKVLTFDPEGQLVNTYFKNIPIFGVEPSFPGDGNIPVIETPYGNLSPIICYDADHPQLIQQVSNQPTDMLVVPTGDWKAISPYHTYMAAVRCIENGVSMLKSTSNGLSAVIDDKGRIQASYDYFDEAQVKKIVYDYTIKSSDTLYTSTFPIYLSFLKLAALFFLVFATVRLLIQQFGRKESKKRNSFNHVT